MQYNQNGTDKRTMESDRARNIISKTAKRPTRSQRAGPARGFKWNIMDNANRRYMEGFAAGISALPNLPQALPATGQNERF
jgi:hypothetical protein